MLPEIHKESCKKVITTDTTNTENGFLIELYKDGPKTTVYLTAAKSGAFKGYHLHKIRASHYVCVKGKMKVTVYEDPDQTEGKPQRAEYILDASNPERLLLPSGVYIGLENIGAEEAWMINFPQPSYDPALTGEQVDKSPSEFGEL